MRKRPWKTSELLLLLAPLGFLLVLGVFRVPIELPASWRLDYARSNDRAQGCNRNLQAIWKAVQLYQADYDKRFPPAIVGGKTAIGYSVTPLVGVETPIGWADSLYPYEKSTSYNWCPDRAGRASNAGPSNLSGYTDYWMNEILSGQSVLKIQIPNSTVFLGEGGTKTDPSDATYAKLSLPSAWLINRQSPAYRHLGGANYLMADGSSHWLKPDQVTTFGGRKNAFALR